MTNLNNVVLEGRLVRDASEKCRVVNGGEKVFGEFTIAVEGGITE